MPYNVYTIQITHDNVDQIVDAAKSQAWTLDHLKDNLEYNEAEDGFQALVLYITVIKANGHIMNCNDVPIYDDSHEVMDHISVKELLEKIQK
jgi:hypothetical protein